MNFLELVNYINSNFVKNFVPVEAEAPADHIDCPADRWRSLAEFLRSDEDMEFDSMMCITGVDYGGEEGNLGVIYNLFSMSHQHKLEVRVTVPKYKPVIPTVENIWRIADWFEREVFDMFGIEFDGHRDLRRLLLPEDWEGYPLRKDYEFPETYHGIPINKVKEGWE